MTYKKNDECKKLLKKEKAAIFTIAALGIFEMVSNV
jgi:hypothetical protein